MLTLLFKAGIPLGVTSVWFLYDRVRRLAEGSSMWNYTLSACPYAMWIYCAHEPMMGMSLELFQGTTGMCAVQHAGNITAISHDFVQSCRHVAGPGWYFVLYVVGGALWIAVLLAAGIVLARCAPRLFELLTGGRGGGVRRNVTTAAHVQTELGKPDVVARSRH